MYLLGSTNQDGIFIYSLKHTMLLDDAFDGSHRLEAGLLQVFVEVVFFF